MLAEYDIYILEMTAFLTLFALKWIISEVVLRGRADLYTSLS